MNTLDEEDASRTCQIEIEKQRGDDILKSWFRERKHIPAEALSFLGWNNPEACVNSHLKLSGAIGRVEVRKSCCALLYFHAQTIIQDVLNWMHRCAQYIAHDKSAADIVRHYTESHIPFRTFSPTDITRAYTRGTPVGPSNMYNVRRQQELFQVVLGAPKISFNAISKYPRDWNHITPYVYIYRGIRDMKNVKGTYKSPDISSWTFEMEVAWQFASAPTLSTSRGKGILRLKLTHHIAALNLHCLPFEGFGVENPCTTAELTETQEKQWRTSTEGKKLEIGEFPSGLGHVSDYDDQYEVLVQPMLIEGIRKVAGMSYDGVQIYEGNEPILFLKETKLVEQGNQRETKVQFTKVLKKSQKLSYSEKLKKGAKKIIKTGLNRIVPEKIRRNILDSSDSSSDEEHVPRLDATNFSNWGETTIPENESVPPPKDHRERSPRRREYPV